VLEIADCSYLLENGRITLEGKGEDLLENEHVKSYISRLMRKIRWKILNSFLN